MSNLVISLLIAAGTATWIFTKLQNRSGNNTRQSLIASGVAGLLIFIFLISLLSMIF